ncbi:MAG: DNA-processing protein DprA [Tropicimonas sp.]|uniref:DNA-processing protein DprA n=1 Tax=Tropicimonas sp. TaxID=2067044 RepID=UPI003A869CFC
MSSARDGGSDGLEKVSSPPPLAPPTSEGTRLCWLRLLRSRRVGTATFYRLMAEHGGDAEAALDALPTVAAKAGLSGYAPCPEGVAAAELAAGRRAGAQPVFIGEPGYPDLLRQISDAPPMLWALGDPAIASRPAIALVGARNASSLGRRAARHLATGIGAAGYVIASGLARGIDAVAHETALATGTIAVVAGGVDVIYPRENAALTAQIAESGLILSEMPPGLRPLARHFPRRNRIVSGLSAAVVVVEAAARSGTLITAREALDQGREVLAVPGHPFDARAAGCNMLIRDGATLVRGPEDVLEALAAPGLFSAPRPAAPRPPQQMPPAAITPRPATPPSPGDDAPIRVRILSLLGMAPLPEDQLLRDLDLNSQDIAGELLEMEMDGTIHRQPGGLLARSA